MKTCENCSSLHNGLYGSGRFCSDKCARGFSTKAKRKDINNRVSIALTKPLLAKICPNCEIEFKTKFKKKIFCSRSCAAQSLPEASRKRMSKIMSIRYSGTGNPMFGKSPTHTKRIKFYSAKNNEEFVLKSSYEHLAVLKLESDKTILSYTYEKLVIPYSDSGRDRNYIPDFKIERTNDVGAIIEVKPESLLNIWNNKIKIDAGKKYAKENNLDFLLWTEKDLGL